MSARLSGVARSSPSSGSSRFLAPIALILSIGTLYFAREVLIPFALAVLFSFLLTPAVKALERFRLGRVLSVGIVLLVALSAVGAIGWVVSNQLIDVISRMPSYRENLDNKIASLQGSAGGALRRAADNLHSISEELSGATPPASRPTKSAASTTVPMPVEIVERPPSTLQSLGNLLAPLIAPMGTAFVVLVFTIFLLVKREDVRNRLIRLVAQRQLNTMTQVLDDAAQRVTRYLIVQFSINTVFGCLIATGLYFIGMHNAVLWGVLAGLLRFIPYIGPLIGGALPFLLALGAFDGWTRPALIFGFFTVVELIASQVIEPLVGGAHTGISPLAILLAAVFWGSLWGPAGLILSTPLTVCVVVLGRYVPQLEFLNVLLGDEPVLAPEARLYQRLLALDQQEAQSVIDAFLKDRKPIDLYDQVIIPALSLAEQDRHKGALDEAKETFVVQSISEVIGEIAEYEAGTAVSVQLVNPARRTDVRVLCLPASDRADEITAAMFSQVVEWAGYPVVAFPVTDSVSDAVKQIDTILPQPGDVVCISALPPFALLNARSLSKQLRLRFPDLKIIVGLWTFVGKGGAAERFDKAFADTVVTTLADALNEIHKFAEPGAEPQDPEASRVLLQGSDHEG